MVGSVSVIRPGRIEEAFALNELTKRSLMHWGYEPAFLDWEPEAITVDDAFMERAIVYVLESDGILIGYYAFIVHEREGATDELFAEQPTVGDDPAGLALDKLFVDAPFIRQGFGRQLWDHAVNEASRLGYRSFSLYADPNAAPFYTSVGARFIRAIPTTWPNWSLHRFVHEF